MRGISWRSVHQVALFIVLAIALARRADAAEGDFVWAGRIGGPDEDYGYSIAVDDSGFVYTTGYFLGTADFDPGPGDYNLTSAGGYDTFVSKLDSSGNFVWARRFGGPITDYGHSIAVDGSGNVYVVGIFAGTSDFDPGPGTVNMTAAGGNDIFISKLDSSGNLLWAVRMGGTASDTGASVAVDSLGNVYTTWRFEETADFDPGSGTYELTSSGPTDVFVSKLDSSGNFVWAKRMGGVDGGYAFSIAVDSSGNVYTTGQFQGTADFDPGVGTYNLTSVGSDAFVSKLDSSGNFAWAKQVNAVGYSVAVDSSDEVCAVGCFQGTVDFDPGLGTFHMNSAGSFDIFALKLDGAGNFSWAKRLGGTTADLGRSVAADRTGNVYIVGQVRDMTTWDILASKLDSSGNLVWTKQTDGMIESYGNAIAVDGSRSVHIAGNFLDTADFEPGGGVTNLTSAGGNDVFVMKLRGGLVVSSITANGGLPDGWSVEYTVVFSDGVTGVDPSDFALTTTGTLTSASVTSVTGSGALYTVTVNTGTGTGTIRLDLVDDDSIINGTSDPLGGSGAGNGDFSMGEVYSVDKSLPVNWLYVLLVLMLTGAVTAVRIGKCKSRM